jgi:serine/threonine-protein kinase PpkA
MRLGIGDSQRVVLFLVMGLALVLSPSVFAQAQAPPPGQLSEEPATATTQQPAQATPKEEKAQTEPAPSSSQKKTPVKIPGKKTLPLRLLTRPFSSIYDKPDASAKAVVENIPTFSIFYAYSTPNESSGWYEVGTDNRGNVKGWMKADDVIEWKQYLTMTFTNPAERKPTVFFSDKEKLAEMAGDSTRSEKMNSIRQTIGETLKDPQKSFFEGFPVIAMEPADFVDFLKSPYMVPIIMAEEINIDGKTARILEIASAVKGSRKETKPDQPKDAPIRDDLVSPTIDDSVVSRNAEIIKDWKADIVFVIDASASMQPYIDGTREVVKESAKAISGSAAGGKISFGLIAYRDNAGKIPGMEYTAKIFCNLEEGADINTFNQKVAEVREAQVGSQGFDEDIWAGMSMGLTDSSLRARPDASLFLIQIGDASAHDPTHVLATTQLDAAAIRQMANAHKPHAATIISMHLQTPEAKRVNDIGKASGQFRAIVNRATGNELYFPVENGDPALFRQQAQRLVSCFIEAQKEATAGTMTTSPPIVSDEAPSTPATQAHPEEKMESAAKGAIMAAQMEYLGSKKTEKGEVKAPRDIRAFAVDRDLEDLSKRPMDVRLLITKNNIDELKKALENVLEAGTKAQISGADFFDELQSVMASSVRDPKMIGKGAALNKMGLMPEFIDGLPYKSEIMNMTNDNWTQMSADEQSEFMTKVKSKIALYQAFYNDRDKWIELNKGDEPGDWVMPLALDALP